MSSSIVRRDLTGVHGWFFDDAAHTQDGRLRRVDNGRKSIDVVCA